MLWLPVLVLSGSGRRRRRDSMFAFDDGQVSAEPL